MRKFLEKGSAGFPFPRFTGDEDALNVAPVQFPADKCRSRETCQMNVEVEH